MIEITLTQALAMYSIALGLLIVIISIYTELTVHRYRRFLEKQYLWRCVFCGFTYLDEGAATISQCPRCQSYNSAEDKHARFVRVKSPAEEAPETAEETAAPHRNPSRRKRPHQRRRGPRRH
ncbi:MAG TPA: hypothetical protein PLO37_18940 [Candidatus Hydrogenedentes bacterium]|nr:hypothetical protein [Candidatus Hydrogenedentota bacterium]HPG68928.1 hypothetical protein [Candidatus Hydrogenedentota bacterium]